MGLFFVLAIGLAGFAVARAYHREGTRAWEAAAAQLGLRYESGGAFSTPRIEGVVRGVHVAVEVTNSSNGRNSSSTTVYSGLHPHPLPPVTFRRQHAMSFLRQVVGGRDVVVGDPRFDDAIVVDAPSEVAIKDYLTPTRRATILSAFSVWRNVELTSLHLRVRTTGRARNPALMVATVNRLVDSCRVLGAAPAVDEALRHRDDGDLHRAAAELHELNATSEPNVVTQMLEAETLVAAGESVEAVPILEEVALALPHDPEVAEWHEAAATAAPPGESGTDAAGTRGPVSLDQQSVIDDLFDPARYGARIETHFETTYAGRQVTWFGEVTQSRGYRSDADFGTEPGTKTTVTIGAVGGSALFSSRVGAVVDLPEGVSVQRDDHIGFRGTLLHVDRFTRTFFVRDAELAETPPERESLRPGEP